MFKPQRSKNPGRVRTAQVRTFPASIGGWNARDPIDAMPPEDAVTLDNWFPMPDKVRLRAGASVSVDGVPGSAEVESLICYRPTTGAQKLFGFAGTAAYDFSAGGGVSVGAAVVSALSNAQWQCTNFSTNGGNFLLCVNGADDMRTFDGTTWAAVNAGSSPAITNVLTANLIGVNIFKERPFYIERASLNVWYPTVQAFAGALTKFSLASVVKKGGFLVAMGNWSVRGGSTIDDLAVFITSEGECAVYQGTDPSQATLWSLVGVYNVGKPIGRNCFLKFGGDLLIITSDGVVPASEAFPTERTSQQIAITDKIQGAMAKAVQLFGSVAGWSLTLFSEQNMLLLSVPAGAGQQVQYVMNTITKAWCRFIGWPANCFETFNGGLYFGTTGEVCQAWTGTADILSQIRAESVSAFTTFKYAGIKSFLQAQPLIAWDLNPAELWLGIDTDFRMLSPPRSKVALPNANAGSEWDSADWDAGTWGGDLTLQNDWHGAPGVGLFAALHLLVVSGRANIEISATNVSFGVGGQM